jgi:predicted enzyme related to lactoylglutathione lyase
MTEPMFKSVDCVMLRAPDLATALQFYSGVLGHELLWRSPDATGLSMPNTTTELVLHASQGPEVDLLVDDVASAFRRFVMAGGNAIQDPFDIAIGRCAVVRDPFGNTIVMLDQTKGSLLTDKARNIVGVGRRATPGRGA